MDITCNCFGVASAARVPVKRYNLLVPDVFPVTEPPFDRPLGITVERKVRKLADYLDKNEHRVPKVSRRLQRRLYSELRSSGYGYVKLAVEAYSLLLRHGRPERSGLLGNELVVRTVVKRRKLLFGTLGPKQYLTFREPHLGSAVGLLLTHESPRLRKLGVDLLIDFIRCQHTSDYVPQLEAFVPLLCANAKPHAAGAPPSAAASASGSPARHQASAGHSSGAAAAAAAVVVEHEEWAALRAACLRALLEHLRFCARLSYVSYHLHTITFAVLECVDASGQGAPQGRYTSPRAMLAETGATRLEGQLAALASLGRGSISQAVGASPPDVAALLVFEELAHMTRDAAEGKKVLEFVMRFLDSGSRWLGSPVAETSLAVLQQACEAEHQRYLLFSTLLRHVAAAERLAPVERAAVLRVAVAEGQHLEAGLAAPALLLGLRELPAVVASSGGAGDVPAMPPLATPVAPSLAPAPGSQQPGPFRDGDAAAGNGSTSLAAQQAIELARLQIVPHLRGPSAGPPAAAAGEADLQSLVLAAVAQLAARLDDGTQLVEAVSSTVGKLRGPAPISTAALQCCVVAAQALAHLPPKARGTGSVARSFPSLLLQELAGVMVHWQPQQRLLAHALLLLLLPAASEGLREQQASMLLSVAWHEAVLPSNAPAAFVALDRTLAALLGAAPAAALPQAVKMLAALQQEVVAAGAAVPNGAAALASDSGRRMAALSAAQACALLCVCASALRTLAVQLGQPALEQLAVPGCGEALPRLGVGQQAGGGAEPAEAVGTQAGVQQQETWQQFWQAPAAVHEFSPGEQQQAAAFLASWRQSSSAPVQQEALVAALAAVPLFKQAGGAADVRFQPIPQSALRPRMTQGSNGSYPNGSEAGNDSRRAARLRAVYKHIRQNSLLDGDRIALATISQESAAEEAPAASLSMPPLGVGEAEGGDEGPEVRSVDEVLADVDAALAAAEEALARGRSPSSAAWASTARPGGGSSSSTASGGPDMRGPAAAAARLAPPAAGS